MRRTGAALGSAARGLEALLTGVASKRTPLSASDLYRICALTQDTKDPLELAAHRPFMQALALQYEHLRDDSATPINPFQEALLKEVLSPFLAVSDAPPSTAPVVPERAGRDGRGSGAAVTRHSPVVLGEPSAEERLRAIWQLLAEASSESGHGPSASGATDVSADTEEGAVGKLDVTRNLVKLLEPHVNALQSRLRELSAVGVASLVKALAVVNYSNYQHTSLLSRRACEVATELPLKDVCRVYYNLHKLNTQDSLQPLAGRLRAGTAELTAMDVLLVAQAMERQTHTSPASAALVGGLATQGARLIEDAPSTAYHRALLGVMARYGQVQHPAIPVLLRNLTGRAGELSERDLLPLLRSVCDLPPGTPGITGCGPALLARAEVLVQSMDVRNLDLLMDLLSFVTVNTDSVMQAVMSRLDSDAGKLSVPQVEFTLRMLSDYPPARGHTCIVSLSFAAGLRAESMDSATLESILASLARLGHYTDDFYSVAEVLQSQKGGFRKLESFLTVLECSPRALPGTTADERFGRVVRNGALSLAPMLSDGELLRCQKLIHALGIVDDETRQRLTARSQQLHRAGGRGGGWRGSSPSPASRGRARGASGGRKPRKPYDPMGELLE